VLLPPKSETTNDSFSEIGMFEAETTSGGTIEGEVN